MLSLNLKNKSDGIVNPCDKFQTPSRISSLNNCVKNPESSFHKIKRNSTDFASSDQCTMVVYHHKLFKSDLMRRDKDIFSASLFKAVY